MMVAKKVLVTLYHLKPRRAPVVERGQADRRSDTNLDHRSLT